MRKALVLAALLAALPAVLLVLPPRAVPGAARAEGLVARANGDTNGDGTINLADAVYLLNWLFRGGDEPVPVVSLPAPPPVTGSTRCFDEGGAAVPCESLEYPGQDGMYRAGCAGDVEGRFADNGDGTVTDTCTGLMWQKDSTRDPGRVWQEALQYGDSVILAADGTWLLDPSAADAHGGVKYDDWRLPNARELESVIDYGRVDPATTAALQVNAAGYWTSTTHAGRPGEAWCVHLFDGEAQGILKAAHLQVVVVRDAR